ncbi:MAG TPA: hypothetical protein VIT92_08965 [Burkholderiaceae bacterium]
MKELIEVGKQYATNYPFIRVKFDSHELSDGEWTHAEIESWQPGVRFESDGFDGTDTYADGVGAMQLQVVSTHKPDKYPERVFYVRQWRDPDGKVFGKPKLRITTAQNFRQLIKGYRHEYEMSERATQQPASAPDALEGA